MGLQIDITGAGEDRIDIHVVEGFGQPDTAVGRGGQGPGKSHICLQMVPRLAKGNTGIEDNGGRFNLGKVRIQGIDNRTDGAEIGYPGCRVNTLDVHRPGLAEIDPVRCPGSHRGRSVQVGTQRSRTGTDTAVTGL